MTLEIKQLASSPSRSGRHLQRYNQGFRQVVGCIPYRMRNSNKSSTGSNQLIEELEVLLISSQKSSKMMFPKGGWELDEDIELAALRETLEEAGVTGSIGAKLGEWIFKSKSQEKFHEGSMFAMLVTEELDVWPEKDVRRRVWMTVNEAREICSHSWMKEALEAFVCQYSPREILVGEPLGSCGLELCIGEELTLSIETQSSDGDIGCYLFS
ncbi:Nudix hydrolase 17- mitochondrial [Striga hermonthica]|uniref:Nudix hydrolase 17- mitochondrial n=1 Tax=Striga hermonthica TaxID=68872 RepID=A0A9N7MHY2_STRHE|nr:Nudix hydrolase 17- mitochondrial [Striga hermonthica]